MHFAFEFKASPHPMASHLNCWNNSTECLLDRRLVPVTIVSGTKICQTRAIERFVAKHAGLYPQDPVAAAHTDAVLDISEDFITFITKSAQGIDIKTQFDEFCAKRKECATTGRSVGHRRD